MYNDWKLLAYLFYDNQQKQTAENIGRMDQYSQVFQHIKHNFSKYTFSFLDTALFNTDIQQQY